jgi:hypothetical protein
MKQLTTNGQQEPSSEQLERRIYALKQQVSKAKNPYPISNLIKKLEQQLVNRKQFEHLAK